MTDRELQVRGVGKRKERMNREGETGRGKEKDKTRRNSEKATGPGA